MKPKLRILRFWSCNLVGRLYKAVPTAARGKPGQLSPLSRLVYAVLVAMILISCNFVTFMFQDATSIPAQGPGEVELVSSPQPGEIEPISSPELPTPAALARKDGECSDPRFKDAELTAYTALVKARTDAANLLARQITSIEAQKKEQLLKYSDDYQGALNQCVDTSCTLQAKEKYDKSVADGLFFYNQVLLSAREEEQRTNKAAQVMYNDVVEKARQLFCARYEAYVSALASEFTKKDICNLEQPFALSGSAPGFSSGFEASFTPKSSTHGDVVFTNNLTAAGCSQSFGGTYVVVFYDYGEGDIEMQGTLTATCEGPVTFVSQTKFLISIRPAPDMVCP